VLGRACRLFSVLVLAPLLVVSVARARPAGATAGPPPPDRDPFYTYSGTVPLREIPPGTVLKTRSTHVAIGTTSTPVVARQLLYRTTGQLGQPTVTVTTVIEPTPVPVLPRIVEYLSFYDGLGAQCDPSYTLAGGNPGAANEQETEQEELLINWYLTHGYTVTVPDFEGTHLDWMAGHESGYGALDAVRATESALHVGHDTAVGLSGYSGGAVAGDWASELAPSYAPDLHLVGVANGGVPANYAHMLAYINGTSVFSAAIPGILIGLTRAYGIDLTPYLSPYGLQVVRAESQVCIGSVFGHYPGLTIQQLMKPQYQDFFHVPTFERLLNDQIMGTAPGHPTEPLLLAVGNVDGTGDGAMVAGDVRSLAHEYCRRGVPVQFEEYKGASHEAAGAFFEPETDAFLQARFDGLPFRGNCSSTG
jgi:Secretory lipase